MTTDELLNQAQTLMDKPETDEEYFNIDWDSREVTIPDGVANLGVYNDKDTQRIYFRCPVQYGEFKVSEFGLHVNYMNTGVSGEVYEGDVYYVTDAEVDGDYMTFSWLVGRRAYLEEGTTAFVVCCKIVDSDNNIQNELNTTVARLPILEGLEVDTSDWSDEYPDLLEEILKQAGEAIAAANGVDAKAEEAMGTATTANERAESAQGAASEAQNTAEEAMAKAQSVEDSAITGITVNGEDVPVENNKAEITTNPTYDADSETLIF